MFNRDILANFYGSENFYRYMGGVIFTDGVKFLMTNGAHWLCSDAMIACAMKPKLRQEEFVSISVTSVDTPAGGCKVEYTDGNGKTLHKQIYDSHELPCDLTFFYENKTFMLATER